MSNDLAALVPANVVVGFPATGAFAPSAFINYTISLASLSLTEYSGITGSPWQKLLHRYEQAVCDASPTPTNDTALTDLATQLAADWYLWQLADMFQTNVGVADWTPEGMHDLTYRQEVGKVTTEVRRGVFNATEDLLYLPSSPGGIATFSGVQFYGQGTGSGTWLCPAEVFLARVEVWGPGGQGNDASSSYGHTSGGGGGAFAMSTYKTVPGTSYSVASPSGSSATVSSFSDGTTSVIADFGVAGGTTGGTGGQASNSTGDVVYSGGNGGICATDSATYWVGGGGGASAGPFGGGDFGQDALRDSGVSYRGQGGLSPGGGSGGIGGTLVPIPAIINGLNGQTPGGGGGGGTSGVQGAGGNGVVRITWGPNVGPS